MYIDNALEGGLSLPFSTFVPEKPNYHHQEIRCDEQIEDAHIQTSSY